MSRSVTSIVLQRADGGSITAFEVGADVDPITLTPDELTSFVEAREAEHPRWVWDDTTQWYPQLLADGVRVKHCADLRLRHNILRNSPLVDQLLLVGDDADQWDNFSVENVEEATLFAVSGRSAMLDSATEFDRQQLSVESCEAPKKLQLLLTAESSAALVATEMTFTGLPWRADIHDRLLTEALGPRPAPNARPPELERLAKEIRDALDAPDLNPDSPADVLRALRRTGLAISDTRSSTLKRLTHPVVPTLLEYKKLQRLHTANGWRWLDTWIRNGRYRTIYVPGGVVTGRWAASGGGALSLPVQLRPAVVADDDWVFVVADAAQLEPRVLAGMSADSAMAKAARGMDLYQNLVDANVVKTREDAKLGMLGAMYGATQGESGLMVARLAQHYPKAFGLVEEAARAGERGESVQTFLGRGSPRPDAAWVQSNDEHGNSDRERRSWGRFTRNFIVQGTGAEWAMCWMATLRNLLWDLTPQGQLTERPHLAFFLHDEIIVHTPKEHAEDVAAAVGEAARRAGTLLFGSFPVDFPLDVSIVEVYADAK